MTAPLSSRKQGTRALCRLKEASGTCHTCVDGLCQVQNGVTLDERLLFRKWNGEMTGGFMWRVGEINPKETVDAPDLPLHPWPELKPKLPFTSPHYATPRGPASTIKRTDTNLRLYGSESLESCFPKSLLARRLTNHNLTATTHLTFSPTSFQQMAGLTAYYNNQTLSSPLSFT